MPANLPDNTINLALAALRMRMDEQSARMTPPLFTFDRNGLRLAIAALEDETNELYEEWRGNKRHLGNAHKEIKHELLDVAAVAMITYVQAVLADDSKREA